MYTKKKGGKARLLVLGLFLLFYLSAGCSDQKKSEYEDRNQRKITDCMGREVMVPLRVDKIVDLAMLDGTRTLVALGAEDKLVGINNSVRDFMYGEEGKGFDCWVPAAKAAPRLKGLLSVGTSREPNIELLKSLEPDLILAYPSQADFARTLEEQTGVPVVFIKASGSFDFSMIKVVGEIVGKKERAEALIAYAKDKIGAVTQKSAQIRESERVKVFFWGWPVQDAPKTIAPYDPIDLAGGLNLAMAAKIRPYETYDITKEQLAVWNPDIILLQWWTRKRVGVRIETILLDPAFQTIHAVKKRQVFYTRNFMRGWDPAMGVCELYYLAKLFYPELYKDIALEKESNEILETFYGLGGLYTDLLSKSELHRFKKGV